MFVDTHPVIQVHIANDHRVRGEPGVGRQRGRAAAQRDQLPLPQVGFVRDVQPCRWPAGAELPARDSLPAALTRSRSYIRHVCMLDG